MVEGIDVSDLVQVVINRREAIALAVASAQPGDFVVVLGKGHEVGQEISGVTYPFDDRLELARAIEELA
jgi:UDP-N-acetylmuramoyl-L-alanyl-D-glutamate--2,6-diaminopimelate ligase